MGIKKGIFYGVGVGPGDPELMTIKAIRTLEHCPVIAAPKTASGEMLALDIARQALSEKTLADKTILPLFFTMDRDKAKQHTAHLKAAEEIERYLSAGQDVAMLNLGDVSIYATYSYLMEILDAKGYQTVMVPGVPSFCAVAAKLGVSLTQGNEPLHIIPARSDAAEQSLDLPGTKVLMKSGKRLSQTVQALQEKGMLEQAAMVQNCGLPEEAVCTDLSTLPETAGYFATIIVGEKK